VEAMEERNVQEMYKCAGRLNDVGKSKGGGGEEKRGRDTTSCLDLVVRLTHC
jgi:hypothetical protein